MHLRIKEKFCLDTAHTKKECLYILYLNVYIISMYTSISLYILK